MHRFLTPGVGSEHFSEGSEGDRIFGNISIYFVGIMLAPRFFSQWLAQDFCAEFAGNFAGGAGNVSARCGGFPMLLMKMLALSGSALILWLAPLVVLDKKVSWHKSAQGLSLCAAIACAVTAGNGARKLSEQDEIEKIKSRAITADVIDEISTSAYISQQQRQQEAEQILNPREHLERSLALTYGEDEQSEPMVQKQLAEPEQNEESERAERALQLKAKGWGKAKIIREVWGISKGGSPKYKAAEAEYERLIEGA